MYKIIDKIFNLSNLDSKSDTFLFSNMLYLSYDIDKELDIKNYSLMILNTDNSNMYSICLNFDDEKLDINLIGESFKKNEKEFKYILNLNQKLIMDNMKNSYKNRVEDLSILLQNENLNKTNLKQNLEDNINFSLEGIIGNLLISRNLKKTNELIKFELFNSKEKNGKNTEEEIITSEFYKTLFDYSVISYFRDFKFFNDQINFYSLLGLNIQKINFRQLGKFIIENY